MSRMMDREELCKHFQEVALDHGKRMAEKVADLVEKSGAAELDRMLRGAVHQFGDALMSESVKLLNKDLRKQGHRCAGCDSVLRFKQHRPLVLRTGLTAVDYYALLTAGSLADSTERSGQAGSIINDVRMASAILSQAILTAVPGEGGWC